MARAAGNSSHYTFRLFNESTGRYEADEIKLVSVTSVIGATLAKPQLVPWAYYQTLDGIEALVTTLKGQDEEQDGELLELLADAGMLADYFKENGLRPEDVKNAAASRGIRAHGYLELLGNMESEAALDNAFANREARDPYKHAIAQWWCAYVPRDVRSESKLWSLRHGFMGTADLIWRDSEGLLHCTDLKTRKAKSGVYDSDMIQGGAYAIAFEEMYGKPIDVVDVLLAREDGTFEFKASPYASDVFLMLLSIYKSLKGVN